MLSVVEVRGMCVLRERLPLIKPVSFDVCKGEVLRITGENGTGKTTLLDTVAGIHHEWEGLLRIRTIGVTYKRQGNAAFESLALDEAWKLVVGANIETYRAMIASLELREFESRPIGLLSGGEAQRAMLALAMVRRHDLVLLDEPLVGVDQKSADLILCCLEDNWESRAVIIVEHKPSSKLRVTREVCLERFDN